jgi:hypothetical protein
MVNLPGERMTQTRPPTHLAFVPAIFLAIIMAFVYMASLFVSGDAPEALTMDSLAQLEKRVSELAEEIVTEAVKVIEPFPSRKLLFRASDRKKDIVKLGEPAALMDFTNQEQAGSLKANSSPDMKATFAIDNNEGSPNPVSAKLLAVISGKTGEKSFASGRITLPEPVPVGDRKSLTLHLKADGLTAVRIAALERRGDQYVIWEKRDVPVGGAWALVAIPFADCDMWLYDSKSHKYTRSPDFSEPKNITDIRTFVQPSYLASSTAMLWIDSISLR